MQHILFIMFYLNHITTLCQFVLKSADVFVLLLTADSGMVGHHLHHVVQPPVHLHRSLHFAHQLPAAEVLESVRSGGERLDGFIHQQTRQASCREEPEELF